MQADDVNAILARAKRAPKMAGANDLSSPAPHNSYIYIHANIHIGTRKHTYMYIHTNIHTYTYICTYLHTHTHIYRPMT